MKAMIWKEWRENLRWALLALVALGLAAAYSLWKFPLLLRSQEEYASAQLLPWMSVASPLLASALGVLQIAPEQRRDHWAFLLHRPVTRDVIFAGKAAAGLSLYGLATLVPVALATLWFATPGHVPAPFDIRMTLPAIADILAGIPFYFAALLVVLRPARWYGSRLLPLLTAVLGALLAYSMPDFWPAVVVSLLCAALLAAAVWGSFRTSGQYAGQPKAAQTALALTLYLSIVAVLLAAVGFAQSLRSSAEPSLGHQPFTYYAVTRSGQIVRVREVNDKVESATDLQGHVVPVSPDGFPSPDTIGSWFGEKESLTASPNSYRDMGRYYVWLRADGAPRDLTWYFSFGQRRILGYSTRSKRLAWIGGPSGVVSAAQPLPSQFPTGLHNPNSPGGFDDRNNGLLVFDNVVYALNLADLRLAPVAVVAPPATAEEIAMLSPSLGENGWLPSLAVKTQSRVQLFSPAGAPLLSVPRYLPGVVHMELEEINRLPHGDRFFFWYHYGLDDYKYVETGQIILETDAQGRVLQRVHLPADQARQYSATTENVLFYSPLVPPGLLLGIGADTLVNRHIPKTMAAEIAQELRAHPRQWAFFVTDATVAGLLCAICAWFIGRRCGWGRAGQWVWTVSVFLLGVYGLLMLIALVPWPTRERCPVCDKKRVVTLERCEHCGAPFAPNVPDGTEIFDEVVEREVLMPGV